MIKHTNLRILIVFDVSQVEPVARWFESTAGTTPPALAALVTDVLPLDAPAVRINSDTVIIDSYVSEQIELSATMASGGLVALSEIFDPGWSVTVDGKSTRLYEVDGALRGVRVPAGSHEITMTYSMDSIRYGIALTVATLLFVVIRAFLLCWQQPATRRPFWTWLELLAIPESKIAASHPLKQSFPQE